MTKYRLDSLDCVSIKIFIFYKKNKKTFIDIKQFKFLNLRYLNLLRNCNQIF